MAKKREWQVDYYSEGRDQTSRPYPDKISAQKAADDYLGGMGGHVNEIRPAVDYKHLICQAVADSKVLNAKVGDGFVVQHSFQDALGKNFLVFSKSDGQGNCKKVNCGEVVQIKYDTYKNENVTLNPYTGEPCSATKIKPIDVQLAPDRANEMFFEEKELNNPGLITKVCQALKLEEKDYKKLDFIGRRSLYRDYDEKISRIKQNNNKQLGL